MHEPQHEPQHQPTAVDVLTELLTAEHPPPFAVLRREDGPDGGRSLEVLVGDVVDVAALADVPLPAGPAAPVLALVPFRQVTERGFTCVDDATPLRCLVASRYAVAAVDDALEALPDVAVGLADAAFDVDDDTYAKTVTAVISDEIGRGEGANFVIRRDLEATLSGPFAAQPARAVLALLRRLLTGEPGAYWTFAVHTPDLSLVGATPERHVSVRGGEVVMNPISGTYRYPTDPADPAGPLRREPEALRADLLRFLRDPKETEELFMVVDEELKMMSEVCDRGGQVSGPYLKQMGHLAHTEYLLRGTAAADVRDVLRATMFAATVTGSPVENACSVITRHEGRGRGYYSGMAAMLTVAEAGGPVDLDAPILIRTAYLRPDADVPSLTRVRVPVGATLVRHSVPESEVAETHAKAAGVLAAFGLSTRPGGAVTARAPMPDLAALPGVATALQGRNATLARFWLDAQDDAPVAGLAGKSALVVDAEDAWTTMLAHLLRRLGMTASVRRWDDVTVADVSGPGAPDLLVSGPGPGDPRDLLDPRMARLRVLLAARLDADLPLLAVCLSHQVLCELVGIGVGPLPRPFQGTQRRVPAFGREVRAGFYNTFAGNVGPSGTGAAHRNGPRGLRVFADPDSGEVFALHGASVASTQFHLESILSPDGVGMLADVLPGVVG
ncbi:MAG: anthranilate synthase family protein [Kineosporiaceae bacterium]